MSEEEKSPELGQEMQRLLTSHADPFGSSRGFSLQAREDDERARRKLLLLALLPVALAIVAYLTG